MVVVGGRVVVVVDPIVVMELEVAGMESTVVDSAWKDSVVVAPSAAHAVTVMDRARSTRRIPDETTRSIRCSPYLPTDWCSPSDRYSADA